MLSLTSSTHVRSSASDMQHYFTVQLYTIWRHPGLCFVYETSLTFRWLTMIANCHVLTTALLTRGPWEKGNVHLGFGK